LKVLFLAGLAALSACSWFGSKPTPVPAPTEIIVTGAPMGSIVFVDGSQSGPANSLTGHPQIIDVAPGPHTVEIHMDATIVYREDTYVGPQRHTLVRVLSGSQP
jgi:hypothetical protein